MGNAQGLTKKQRAKWDEMVADHERMEHLINNIYNDNMQLEYDKSNLQSNLEILTTEADERNDELISAMDENRILEQKIHDVQTKLVDPQSALSKLNSDLKI